MNEEINKTQLSLHTKTLGTSRLRDLTDIR